jgi:hypothetical protein
MTDHRCCRAVTLFNVTSVSKLDLILFSVAVSHISFHALATLTPVTLTPPKALKPHQAVTCHSAGPY